MIKIRLSWATARSNWVTFTATQSATAWEPILDYTAEDYAELVEHYFLHYHAFL